MIVVTWSQDGYFNTGHIQGKKKEVLFTVYVPFLSGKECACQAGDGGLIPALGKSPRKENGNPLKCSCLGNTLEEPGGL